MHGWWMAEWYQQDPLLLFCWVFWTILSICLHELGHGYVAIQCGDNTPRWSGHMTMNPFVHIPVRGWVMFALVGITFGLMPVNPSRFRRTTDDALVAAAGPAVNLVLAIVLVLIGAMWVRLGGSLAGAQLHQNIEVFLRVGVALNVASFLFNLIPVPPLDGSRVLAVFSRSYRQLISTQQAQMVGMIILFVLVWTIGGVLYPFAFDVAAQSLIRVVRVLRAIAP